VKYKQVDNIVIIYCVPYSELLKIRTYTRNYRTRRYYQPFMWYVSNWKHGRYWQR